MVHKHRELDAADFVRLVANELARSRRTASLAAFSSFAQPILISSKLHHLYLLLWLASHPRLADKSRLREEPKAEDFVGKRSAEHERANTTI